MTLSNVWNQVKWRILPPLPCPMCGKRMRRKPYYTYQYGTGYYCSDSLYIHYDTNEEQEYFRLSMEDLSWGSRFYTLIVPRAGDEAILLKTMYRFASHSESPDESAEFRVPKSSLANFDPKHPEELVQRIETLIAFS